MSLLVFGWYSLKIKSFKGADLIADGTNPDSEYQIRQRVFHIMYIPVFPLDKLFIEKIDDLIYPVSDDILTVLKQQEKVRTPWYSFSFPLLVCLSFVVFMTQLEIKEYLHRKHVREEFYINQKQISNEIEELSEHHFIELREVDNWIKNSIYYLKIEGLDSLNIYASKLESGIGLFDSPRKVRKSYKSLKDKLTKTSIEREDFKELQLNDSEVYLNKTTYGYKYPIDCGFDIFGDGKRYIIKDIYDFNGPVLKYSSKTWSSKGKTLTIYFDNYGDEFSLIDIKNLEGFDTNWNNELPLTIKNHFSINATGTSGIESKYGVLLRFKDSINNIHTFEAYRDNSHDIVHRLIQN